MLRDDGTGLPDRPVPHLLAEVPADELALVVAAAATALARGPDRPGGLTGGPSGWVLQETRTLAMRFTRVTAEELMAATAARPYDEQEWRRSVQALATVPAQERPVGAAAALLAVAPGDADPLVVLGLASVLPAGRRDEVFAAVLHRAYADDLERLEVLGVLDLSLEVLAAMLRVPRWAVEPEVQPPGVPVLTASPPYLALARSLLAAATDRLDGVQAGTLPYVADGAVSSAAAHSVARAARVLLHARESVAGLLVQRLLPASAVAPTAARTLPSQALCLALAQAVVAEPTPDGVEALAAAGAVVRHAGVSKKLDRLLPQARRSLARRSAGAR